VEIAQQALTTKQQMEISQLVLTTMQCVEIARRVLTTKQQMEIRWPGYQTLDKCHQQQQE
jgi:hypothetical protein